MGDELKSPDLAVVLPTLIRAQVAGGARAAAGGGGLPINADTIKDAWNIYQALKPAIDWLVNLIRRRQTGTTPAPPPPPPVVVIPAPPVPVTPGGAVDDINEIRLGGTDGTGVRWLEEPERWHNGERGHLYDLATFRNILRGGGAADNDSRVAYDFTPVGDSGTPYGPDDPRWKQVRKSLYARHAGERDADCPTWFEYRFNGAETDGPGNAWGQGAQSSDVEPESVVSDGFSPVTGEERRNGCTPVALCKGKGVLEARLHYIRHDNRVVSSPWTAAVRFA
jgi:hypothetical protein